MGSPFERTYQIDPAREAIEEIESRFIELSDEQILMRALGSVIEKINQTDPGKEDAQNTSEVAKKKPAKNNRKSHKPAVESVQEEL